MTPVLVLTTVGETFDAAGLATQLVSKGLVACVNILPEVRSIYRWQGRVDDDREQLLVMKTTAERVDALRESLFASHPYEVPEFVVLTIDSISEAYRHWLVDAVR